MFMKCSASGNFSSDGKIQSFFDFFFPLFCLFYFAFPFCISFVVFFPLSLFKLSWQKNKYILSASSMAYEKEINESNLDAKINWKKEHPRIVHIRFRLRIYLRVYVQLYIFAHKHTTNEIKKVSKSLIHFHLRDVIFVWIFFFPFFVMFSQYTCCVLYINVMCLCTQ